MSNNGTGMSGYCYDAGYTAGSGNYEPSTSETVAQGVDAGVCEYSGHGSDYAQGYTDAYNDTNPNAEWWLIKSKPYIISIRQSRPNYWVISSSIPHKYGMVEW